MTKSLQDYVVSRELAEELKKAGYPQEACNHWQISPARKWGLYRSSGLLWRESSKYSYAAPLSDEILEQLPLYIGITEEETGVLELSPNSLDGLRCEYLGPPKGTYQESLGAQYEEINADALARLWLWCKAEGHIE